MQNNFEGLNDIVQLLEFHKIAIFILGIFFLILCSKAISEIGNKLIKKLPSKRLVILQIVTIIIFVIYIAGTIIVFYRSLQPPKELLIAMAGSAAVAIGLSLKDLVSSLISGLVLLFDQPFQVGDRVRFGDDYGEITSIGLRAVRLVTLNDDMVTIPNSRFLTEVVSSSNNGNMDMMTVNDFYLAIDADVDAAKAIISEILITSKYIYLAKPFNIVVSEILSNNILAINLKVKSYVLDVKYEKHFQNEIVSRVINSFNSNGMKRPLAKV